MGLATSQTLRGVEGNQMNAAKLGHFELRHLITLLSFRQTHEECGYCQLVLRKLCKALAKRPVGRPKAFGG